MADANNTTTTQRMGRVSAHRINPLIGDISPSDTLNNVADLITDLGFTITSIYEHERQDSGHARAQLGSLYLIFDAIAAAVKYEESAIAEHNVLARYRPE